MNNPREIHNLALIGFMGTGKSSVGRALATQLRFEFVDTDELIERRGGRTITQIFAKEGEAGFRALERALVMDEMPGWRKKVIATGGGLAANEANLKSLKQHALVVCLWASPALIWERVRKQSHRPLLQSPDPLAKIRGLLDERGPFYRQADVLVNTENRSVREVALQVLHHFQSVRPRPSRSESIDPTTRR